ncbi:MAG TPA: hypothetical protein QGF95_08785 [Candidatus Latescibacteria bacterium]|nr:hypothetical protein [Candidatus Latescibacterota bacterium]
MAPAQDFGESSPVAGIARRGHRFALKNHREQRAKSTLTSALDDIPGIGPKKRNDLLVAFGSAKRIAATPAAESAAPDDSAAQNDHNDNPGDEAKHGPTQIHRRITTPRNLGHPLRAFPQSDGDRQGPIDHNR